MATLKKCSKCAEVKPLDAFSLHPGRADGRFSQCKDCVNYYMRHHEEIHSRLHCCTACEQEKPRQAFRWNPKFGVRTECVECEKVLLRCSECKVLRIHDEFPPCKRIKTGRHSVCNDCHNSRMSEKYRTDPQKRARHKAYNQSEKSKAWRKEQWRKLKNDPGWKEYRRQYCNWKYHNDPVERNKIEARAAINFGIKYGFLTRPDTCQSNGKYGAKCSGIIEAHHHNGYDRKHWLDVEWLCVACHRAADAQKRNTTTTA